MSETLKPCAPLAHTSASVSIECGEQPILLKTGGIAMQATSTVWAQSGETVVLVPCVALREPSAEATFLPLSLHYHKRKFSDGQISGARDRREGRPTTPETIVSRIIDRALRPTFPVGFYNEVQISPMVVSSGPNTRSDILALLGASTAVALSGLPCIGPVAAVRVAYIDKQFIINPTQAEMDRSSLDLVIAGTETTILMVEAEANVLKKEVLVEAVLLGHERLKTVAKSIREFAEKVGQPKWEWKAMAASAALEQKVQASLGKELGALHEIKDKIARKTRREKLRERVIQVFRDEEAGISANQLETIFKKIESQHMKAKLLTDKVRLDGRNNLTIRPIQIEVGLLPRVHGSVLFTRGETQALVTATLGSERDAELVEGLDGITRRDTFMLHYNFPPYSVGEVGQMGSPKRREIGHGNLAKRAMRAVLPDEKECPYVLRVVSDIMSANGSSSMATVCGTSLALMDAGIPIKGHVAGIAMGLVKEGDKFVVLSDISEDEDHIGDMDLKVTGTREGITALQLDIKTDGINREILCAAIDQGYAGIQEILDKMEATLASSRQKVSPYAPQMRELTIPVTKIQTVIGKGGATIRGITEETGTLIDIHRETGLVRISSADASACELAIQRIREMTEAAIEPEVGATYEGTVVKLMQSGAIVSILPGCRGFVHISEVILDTPNQTINDLLQEKQRILVKVLGIDRQKNKIKLTMKDVLRGDAERSG